MVKLYRKIRMFINLKSTSSSLCYKTYCRGNVDFSKIKKLKKVFLNLHRNVKNVKKNFTLELFIAFNGAYSCCSSLDFLQCDQILK